MRNAASQQFERLQDRQSGTNQGDELLVEDQELIELQLPFASPNIACEDVAQAPAGPYRIDQKSLLGIAVPDLRFRDTLFHIFLDLAAFVGKFAHEFHGVTSLDGSTARSVHPQSARPAGD